MKRHNLTPQQAQILADIEQRKRKAIQEWEMAIALVGLDSSKIVSGKLGKDPHFIVSERDDLSA